MIIQNDKLVQAMLGSTIGRDDAAWLGALLHPMMPFQSSATTVSRAQLASAMTMVLFKQLIDVVPTGRSYVQDVEAGGGRIMFDHGAIRTIQMPHGETGALPRGERAFRRILEPLGYEVAAVYPLPRLKMTGRAYRHRDFPETIPQFFVSELHVEAFPVDFAQAAERVFGTSRDPLDAATQAVLDRLSQEKTLTLDQAITVLPVLTGTFGRHHARPMLADYDLLKRHSAEAAWIATEGNAFNHATDRVADVVALAEAQRAKGRPIKERIEVSASGRVRQTAFRADAVERAFGVPGAPDTIMSVPGSFYEFISRDVEPVSGALDLSFDSGNATGIFGMTKAA